MLPLSRERAGSSYLPGLGGLAGHFGMMIEQMP